MGRKNLIKNPSVETSLLHYFEEDNGGCATNAITRSTTEQKFGGYSIRVEDNGRAQTFLGAGKAHSFFIVDTCSYLGNDGDYFSVEPNTWYCLSFYMKATAWGGSVQYLNVYSLDENKDEITGIASPDFGAIDPAAGWTRIEILFKTKSNSHYAFFRWWLVPPDPGYQYIDGLMLEKIDTVTQGTPELTGDPYEAQVGDGSWASTYIDGDQFNCEWLGDPHDSASVRFSDEDLGIINVVKNPSFETDLAGWHPTDTTYDGLGTVLSRSTAQAYKGSASMLMEPGPNDRSAVVYTGGSSESDSFTSPTTEQDRWYILRFAARLASGETMSAGGLEIALYDKNDKYIFGTNIDHASLSDTAWFDWGQAHTWESADLTDVKLVIHFLATPTPHPKVHIDAVMVSLNDPNASFPKLEYFDGDEEDAVWLGTSHASKSLLGYLAAPNHAGPAACSTVIEADDDEQSTGPISLRLGEKREQVTDLSLNTPAGPLTFTRSYRQSKLGDADFQFMGLGWRHNHALKLAVSGTAPNRTATVTMSEGGVAAFTETTTDHFEGDAGSNSIIDWDGTSSEYTLTAEDKSTTVFDSSGNLKERGWPNGETWTYTYSSGELSEVDDGFGRKLQFTYISNPGQFDDGQLWRVGDHDATGLSGGSPTGRYVEFSYTEEKSDGSPVQNAKALLTSVRDVLGETWTYDYFGQDSGETDTDKLNFITEVGSPSVDTTGDGTKDGALTLKELAYTFSSGTLTDVNQKRGNALIETDFKFQPSGLNVTEETTAGKKTTHRFGGGVYAGPQDPGGNTSTRVLNANYRPVLQLDPNANPTYLDWSDDGKHLEYVTDALGNQTNFIYDSDDRLISSTDAEGRATRYVYTSDDAPRQPTHVFVTRGGDLAVNGGMEADSSWSSVGTPTTNARSSTQVDTGTYARHVVTDAAAEGVEGADFDLAANTPYAILARVYVKGGVGNEKVKMTVTGTTDFDVLSTKKDAWETLYVAHTPTSASTDVNLQFLADGGTAEFYVDSVAILEGPSILRWEEFAYDTSGRVTSEKTLDPADGSTKQREVTRTYYTETSIGTGAGQDYGAGMLKTVTQKDPEEVESDATTTYFYDSPGRLLQTNQSTTFGGCSKAYTVYDDAGRVVAEICHYENTGDPPTTAQEAEDLYDPAKPDENHVTTHVYDELGRRIQTTTMAGSSEAVATLTAYDALDRVVRTIRNYVSDISITHPYTAAHAAFDHGSDNNENLVTDAAYNARGEVVSQTDVEGAVTLFGYDDAGRQVKVIHNASNPSYDASYATGDPDLSAYTPGSNLDEDIISEQAYDAAGNGVKTTDPVGNVTFTVYDALNRPVKTVRSAKDAATVAIQPGEAGYVAANDPRSGGYVASTDPDRDIIETPDYDRMGRVIRTTDPVGVVTLHGYDSQGRGVIVVRNAVDTNYDTPAEILADPDLSGYTESSNVDEDLITQTTYDATGRVLDSIDLSGAKTRQAYDGFGRVIRTVGNYDGTGLTNPDPEDWAWDDTDGRWEDGATNAIPHGAGDDQNIVTETVYDDDGRVQYTRDVLGRRTWSVYDALGRRVKTIVNCTYTSGSPAPEDDDYVGSTDSDKDVITRTVYDAFGRVSAQIGARGNATVFSYDVLGRRTETVLNFSNGVYRDDHPDLDRITTTTYDVAGRVATTRDQAGIETRYTYDEVGRLVKVIRNYVDGTFDPATPDQDVITRTEYDRAGRVTATVDARGTRTAFGYDAAGRRRTVTLAADSPLATLEWTAYDKAGRVLRTLQNCTYDPAVDPNSPDEQDGGGNWLYDPQTHGRFADQDLITEFTLDKAGRATSGTDPVGNAATSAYNKDGTRQSTTDPLGNVTRFVYDALLRQVMVVQNYDSTGLTNTDPADWVFESGAWNDGSSPTPVAIPHGTENDTNVIALLELDTVGRRTKLIDPRGNATTYAYDQLDRRTSLTDPLSNAWSTAFADLSGGAGTRQTLTDPKTNDTQRDFDRLGRPTAIRYLSESPKDTPDVTFDYDILGELSAMAEWDGATLVRETRYGYDALGRLTAVEFDTDGDGTVEESVQYAYDAGGRRTRLVLPDGKTVRYEYDTRGQLVNMADWDRQGTAYAYDGVGRLIEADRSSGYRSAYHYDAGGRLRTLRHEAGSLTLGHFAYEVDALGNRTEALEALPHPATTDDTTIASTDDAVDYAKGAWTTSGAFKRSTDFSAELRVAFFGDDATLTLGTGPDHSIVDVYLNGVYWRSIDGYAATSGEQAVALNMEGQGPHVLEIQNRAQAHPSSTGFVVRFKQLVVTDQTYDLHTIQYTYDALSRLLDADYFPGVNTAATAFRGYDYSYDLAGNRTQKVVTINGSPTTTNYTYNAGNQLTSDGTNTFTYDSNGNLTNDGVNSYTWDRANRLLSHAGSSYAYDYDGAGRRISQTISGTVTDYLLDVQPGLWNVLAETTSGATTRYLHGPLGIHGQQDNAGNWRWTTHDALGSVRAEADANLAAQAARQFAPYGDSFGTQGSFATPFAFTGEPTDDNGLVNLRARYYNPTTSVFPSRDPIEGQIEQPKTLNWYSYGLGNPVLFTDPTGLRVGQARCDEWPVYQGLCRQADINDNAADQLTLETALDSREEIYRQLIQLGRLRGQIEPSFKWAAELLEHNLNGNGSFLEIDFGLVDRFGGPGAFPNDPGIARATRVYREPRITDPEEEPQNLTPLLWSYLLNYVRPVAQKTCTRFFAAPFVFGHFDKPTPRPYNTGWWAAFGHVPIMGIFAASGTYSASGFYDVEYRARYVVADRSEWFEGTTTPFDVPGGTITIPHDWMISLQQDNRASTFGFRIQWVEAERLLIPPAFDKYYPREFPPPIIEYAPPD